MRTKIGLAAALTALLGAAVVLAAQAPAGAAVAYPTVIAATGDSITRAYDVNWLGALRDNPAYSWSTGANSTVRSQYSRLLAAAPAISGHAYNDAKTGAKMADLDGQLKTAAAQVAGAGSGGYVTVLMGANDVCTSSAGTMTPTATVQAQFQKAMADLVAVAPAVKVFVSSIPNVYQLWSVLHTNSSAVSTWRTFGICQSMLASSNTEAQRQAVLAQEQADNQAIAAVCASAQFASTCRWDGYATYNVTFAGSDVSTVDYFHPSPSGQAKLAATTWAASYWGA